MSNFHSLEVVTQTCTTSSQLKFKLGNLAGKVNRLGTLVARMYAQNDNSLIQLIRK